MQRSGSQKVLLVLSIISIIVAVIGILFGIMKMLGGALLGMVPADEAASALSESGLTQQEAGAFAGLAGFIVLIGCVIELIVGILGVRAANDNQKIMPVWVLAIIELILSAISLGSVVANGSFSSNGLSAILSLVIAVLMLWIANNIKREAGK